MFLIALASGKRRSELHAFSRADVTFDEGDTPGMTFISKTHMKTRGIGALKPVFIPSLPAQAADIQDDELVCPVRCMKQYLLVSDAFRSPSQERLFIPWTPGIVKDLKPQTISSYLKQAVVLAYQAVQPAMLDSFQIRPHSVRHVATSLAALKHYNLDDVLLAGSWVSNNAFISNYLQDYSVNTITGLKELGGFIAGGAHFLFFLLYVTVSPSIRRRSHSLYHPNVRPRALD